MAHNSRRRRVSCYSISFAVWPLFILCFCSIQRTDAEFAEIRAQLELELEDARERLQVYMDRAVEADQEANVANHELEEARRTVRRQEELIHRLTTLQSDLTQEVTALCLLVVLLCFLLSDQ